MQNTQIWVYIFVHFYGYIYLDFDMGTYYNRLNKSITYKNFKEVDYYVTDFKFRRSQGMERNKFI